ncbi:unnamed protein product [Effrenium voratum]|uniref:Uncharacterized protein n=1 Tax=Effrenium voratum TaxID=2562239 RepID=A0AA36MW11_9DINO|nr:unnamed protein product [Effrenium voratum]
MPRPPAKVGKSDLAILEAAGVTLEDLQHWEDCGETGCDRRNIPEWHKKLQAGTSGKTWLCSAVGPDGAWTLQCWVCKAAKVDSAWSTGVATKLLGNMQRHHKSHQHQEALAKLGLGEFEQDLETAEDFQKVMKSRKETGALRQGVAGVGGRKKITQMQYCLGRALFTLDQEFLRNAQVIAISEDVRQHKVLIRYAACDSNLQIRSGLLGYFELGTHSGNIGLRKAMKVALEVFCLDFDGEVDRGLLEHIADKVELFTADAASDEQLAQGLFANLRFVTKDRAHASTRLLERPWQADSELSRIVDQLALGRSVVRRIHNSPHLSTIFAQYCQQMNDAPLTGARIKNLSVAKQRFASISKPVGRRVLYLEALLNTIVWILVNRGPSTDEGKLAIEFLEVMGEEQLVLAGMISDLSDECMRLVRYFDGDYDLAGTCVQLKCFMVRIHFLVNQGRIFDTVGYTQRCIHQLQNARGFIV